MIPVPMEDVSQKVSDKQRIVITGSEGAKFLASVMKHILTSYKKPFDYYEDGKFETQPGSCLVIIVAGEKLSDSDSVPDFRKYNHHIGIICNISHNPENGFNSEDEYIRQYDLFADSTPKGGILAYCEQDPIAAVLCNKERSDVMYLPFKAHPNTVENGITYLLSSAKEKLQFAFSENHNLQYVGGAKEVLKRLGITSDQFYQAIVSFTS